MANPLSLLLRKLTSKGLQEADDVVALLVVAIGKLRWCWRGASRGGGAGALLVGEDAVVERSKREGFVGVGSVVIIRADGEEVGVPAAAAIATHCCWTVPLVGGADGVAAGQRSRSAKAERDLRSCPIGNH